MLAACGPTESERLQRNERKYPETRKEQLAIDRWKFCEYCGEPFKPESMKARYCSESHPQAKSIQELSGEHFSKHNGAEGSVDEANGDPT